MKTKSKISYFSTQMIKAMSETLNQRNHKMHALLKRNVLPCFGDYRLGFNLKELENEIQGDGMSKVMVELKLK